ncbi:hypothetical protein SHJG_0447 [Streptomyces hygroscopicus subsp. jinggangensis 5008]|nr:hypothetical protein SHJG_0447 [Streptomyces hygroscopicus subsp. jinggangensis 5008]AGF59947.1 hypothetical protein SHJGH_0281 [Streptomyces hygroscopicus subsp. jinggangensis TL01]
MHVLIPDDPVFFAKFESLEEPLLRQLHRLHSEGLETDDEDVISDAYDSWVQVLVQLPLWFEWYATSRSAGPTPGDRAQTRYVLYGPGGDQLTSLYPVEVAAADLGNLIACLELFAAADQTRSAAASEAGTGTPAPPPGREQVLPDALRRVLDVLLLSPSDGLLDTLRQAGALEPVVSVTLSAEQETDYRRFCEDIVAILSSGDAFAYRNHRALYF